MPTEMRAWYLPIVIEGPNMAGLYTADCEVLDTNGVGGTPREAVVNLLESNELSGENGTCGGLYFASREEVERIADDILSGWPTPTQLVPPDVTDRETVELPRLQPVFSAEELAEYLVSDAFTPRSDLPAPGAFAPVTGWQTCLQCGAYGVRWDPEAQKYVCCFCHCRGEVVAS